MMIHYRDNERGVVENLERADRLRQLMNDAIRNLSPQERDRRMQIHLAQARGPLANAKLLCDATNLAIRMNASKPRRTSK